MSQAPALDALDELGVMYRRLLILDAGGRAAEQDAAARLIVALDASGKARGVAEPRYADGNLDVAAAMVRELRDDAAAGRYGPLPSWTHWALRSGELVGAGCLPTKR